MAPFAGRPLRQRLGRAPAGPRRPHGPRGGPRGGGRRPRALARPRWSSPRGGTESDNLAVLGRAGRAGRRPATRPTAVVCSAVEHAAVLEPVRAAARAGRAVLASAPVELREAPVDADGVVDLDALADAAGGPDVALVSVMLANNEVGTIQPLDDGGRRWCAERAPRAVAAHRRRAGAPPGSTWPRPPAGADLVSVSAHKLGGPKGVGALVVRGRHAARPAPPRRRPGAGAPAAGTHDVAGIVGLAAALRRRPPAASDRGGAGGGAARPAGRRAAGGGRRARSRAPAGGRGAAGPLPPARSPGSTRRSCWSCSTTAGVCASAGAACASGALEPSHVLLAMGVSAGRGPDGGPLHPRRTPPPRPTSTGRWPSMPPTVVDRLRAGLTVDRPARWQTGGPCGCWWPCRVGSTPRWRRRCWPTPGHDVVGATLKLWGGASDSGCCSVADVDDARRVAQQLGIAHHVFNLTDEFEAAVVDPYVAAHAAGRTPNPCIECNRHIKFDRLLERARRLGFDALATGHHARVVPPDGRADRRPTGSGAGPTRPRTSPTCCRCWARPSWPGCVLPGRRADQGRGAGPGRPARACARPTSPTARTSASSAAPRAGSGFLGRAPGAARRPRWSTRRSGAVGGRGRRGRAGHRRPAAGHRARPPTAGGATSWPSTSRPAGWSWAGAEEAAADRRLARSGPSPGSDRRWRPGRPGRGPDERPRPAGRLHLEPGRRADRPLRRAAIRPVAPGQTVALYDAADPDAVVGAGVAASIGRAGPGPVTTARTGPGRRRAGRCGPTSCGT